MRQAPLSKPAATRTDEAGNSVSRQETPLNFGPLFAIYIAQLNEGIQVGLPYLIAVYMVRDWYGFEASEEKASQMTGLLAASFCAAQFTSSMIWGSISDKYGRKNLVTMSNISSTLFVLGFGLAPNYWLAFMFRCLGGLTNCTFLNVKAMLGELCDATNQGRAMSYLGVSWGLGCIAAPVLGGALAQPCESYGPSFPLCGPGGLLQIRPYFLPCAATSLIAALATVSSICLMHETLPSIVQRRHQRHIQHSLGGDIEMAQQACSRGVGDSGNETELLLRQTGSDLQDVHSFPGTDVEGLEDMQKRLQRAEQQQQHDESDEERQSLLQYRVDALKPEGIKPWTHAALTPDAPDVSTVKDGLGISAAAGPESPWYKSRQVQLSLLGYAMVAFSYNLMDELVPLYASAAIDLGGLKLAPSNLAIPLTAAGPVMIAFSFWGFPPLERAMGTLRTMRWSLLAAAPLNLLVPMTSIVAGNTPAVLSWLAASFCCIRVVSTSVFTCSMVMVNNSGPRSQLGAINGAGQAVAAFVRALGPALGGVLWGASLHLPVPGHQYVVFALVTGAMVLLQIIYAAL
ncbi:hypothetical protein WJX74_009288 [Apatococcus lobatus]|uniref:Major facilitator superfamily (MFS) profile domain-containing protein n=1 Tax=Apatococcus lobatus TaxID=904363 RepID=A0AAW1S6Y7_9CHLO